MVSKVWLCHPVGILENILQAGNKTNAQRVLNGEGFKKEEIERTEAN